jgi:hypothetical protein
MGAFPAEAHMVARFSLSNLGFLAFAWDRSNVPGIGAFS